MFPPTATAEISPSAGAISDGTLLYSDLSSWLLSQSLPLNQTNLAIQTFWGASDTLNASSDVSAALPVSLFVNALMAQSSLSVICPVIPTDGTPAATVVFPGQSCDT